ncbi:amino acid adenylation domain-containing protein [Actinophytocola sp.]|uniref:amino acid adenylation domain-containing protein n=1 Tax=Actinophytocola sp. TaxID=1872138 RepID=UPI002EDB76E0
MNGSRRTPLTAYQRDIWTAAAGFPGQASYNVAGRLRFSRKIDIELMADCARRMLARHDGLRLRFGVEDGVPYQWADPDPQPVEIVDFSAGPDPRGTCEAWMDEIALEPIDLTRGQPCRVAIVVESVSVTYFFFRAHHLQFDGTAGFVALTQMLLDYEAVSHAGTTPDLPNSSYLEYVDREQRFRSSREWSDSVDALRARLAGVAPALFARPANNPAARPERFARHSFTIDRSTFDRLNGGAHTFYAQLVAAVATYLGRIHSADEVVVGIPFDNRGDPRDAQVVGNLANTVPARIRVADCGSMAELVAQAQDEVLSVKQHESIALGDLMRELSKSGVRARQLFDATVTYTRMPDVASLVDFVDEWRGWPHGHTPYPLAFAVREYGRTSDVAVEIDYDVNVFDDDLPIESVGQHIMALLRGGLDQPDEPLDQLPMLSPRERDELVEGRNSTAVPYPATETVHGLFERQAGSTPERVAVAWADGTVSYAELDARANQLARALREQGVRPGDRVAVAIERSPELIVALLATMKSGGAYVPVDPGYPAERIELLLTDSRASVVLARGQTPIDAPPGTTIMQVDESRSMPTTALEPAATAHDLAYVIYTSGSTGQPKGVMVEHHSVVNRLAWMQKFAPLGPDDVVLQKTPSSFDVSVWEFFWWAVEGARVALLRAGGENDPREILHCVEAHNVTVVHFVPAMLAPFLDLLDRRPELVSSARSLRTVFCSGEALPARLVEQFNRIFHTSANDHPRLVNLYGPTEATVDVSYHECPGDPAVPVTRVPIGRPIDNTRLYVLGTDGQPQPVGVAGELCIAGVGVARGYLGRPELTAEKFVKDPFQPGRRMYRTGDLARWLASGELDYLGRTDHQVKIRGNRVELGEVEHALSSMPGVHDVVVVDVRPPDRGTYLTGYYVADHAIPVDELRRHLAQRLPQFMIPAQFARLDTIPLLPNGKADRKNLSSTTAGTTAKRVEPRTALQETLAEIWSEVLDTESVGIDDNYYNLGGDSILVLRICALAEQQGLDLRPHDIAERPTIAELAAELSGRAAVVRTSHGVAPFALVSGADRPKVAHAADAYPVTRLQLGMLFHSREHEGSTLYHDVFRYRLRMDWHEKAFRAALAGLAARHPALRTSFQLGGLTEPMQLVHHDVALPLDVTDVRTEDADAVDARVRAQLERWRRMSYRLDRAPLYHVHVFPAADTVDVVLAFHHALFDGWSAATLISELLQDYLHRCGRDVPAVADGDVPGYADFVAAEREALESAESRVYWRDLLAGSRATTLSGFRRHEPREPADRTSVWHDLPAEVHDELRAFALARGLPVKSVLFAVHCLTLRLFSGASVVTTGLVSHGRQVRIGAERTVGLYLNTMPVRVGTAAASWRDVVELVFAQERASARHNRYPLSAIQDDLGGEPVLETSFNYVDFHQLNPVLHDFAGVELLDVEVREDTNFLLAVTAGVDPRSGSMSVRVDGNPESITVDQADLYARTYLDILGRLTQVPDERIDYGFLPDRSPVFESVVESVVESAPELVDVVTQFERQARSTPDAIAVVDGERRWAYRQLNDSADRVAQRLRSCGAPKGSRIGIALDRSPESIATVLGIAKAGAACVPLDVTYPAQRLADMQEQARPFRVVVSPEYAGLVADPQTALLISDVLDTEPRPADESPATGVGLADIAYVLFTSGSTGRPKGVAMPHRALANMVTWQLTASSGLIDGRAPHTLQFAPPSFDVSFQEIYATLCGGGTVHLVAEQDRRDPVALLRLLDRSGVERVFLPYVALQQLAVTAQRLSFVPSRLRIIAPAGEQLRVTDEIRALCKAMPDAILENQYGLTETHLVTAYTMDGDPDTFPELPPIGPPVDGAVVRLLDERLRPVPDGVRGEIYLGGNSLAEGYEGRPDLTDERFVQDPCGPAGSRLIRSGDLGRRLPGGAIVCDGRTDRQAKVRGFRVEPAEVELAILESDPGVREAAVVVQTGRGSGAADGDSFLTAFLVGEEEAVDLEALRRTLRTRLPDYLVPKYLEWLATMPLTPSGKRADAELVRRRPGVTRRPDYVAPRDPRERAIADMMSEIVGVARVGVHDDFFALGGTSLSVMRLVVTIENRFGVEMSISKFAAAPTVAELATQLRGERAEDAYDPLVAIRPGGTRPPIFLVHPIGGSVLPYVAIARHLPDDQPLYGLQAAGIEPGTRPLTSFADMARSYVDAIRRVQPQGPYNIGGWSLGGTIAFEMVHQLVAGGDEVDNVILIDPMGVRTSDLAAVDGDLLHDWFMWELLWPDRGAAAPPVSFPARADTEEAKLRFVLEQAIANGVLPGGASINLVRRLFGVFKAVIPASAGYRPRPVSTDLTVLNAVRPLPDILARTLASAGNLNQSAAEKWRELTTGHVDLVDIPGDHFTIMEEPNVQHVAGEIAKSMANRTHLAATKATESARRRAVRVEHPVDGVALVTLDRAESLNGIDGAMADELVEVFAGLAADEVVSVVVVTGAGQGFSVGAGLPAGRESSPVELTRRVNLAVVALNRLPQLTIAAVNGPAMGAGWGLAMACDIRVAGPTVRFGAPLARVGAGPDSGLSHTLPRTIGYARAVELLATGRIVHEDEAVRLGLVSSVVGNPVEEAIGLASTIAAAPVQSVRSVKSTVQAASMGYASA